MSDRFIVVALYRNADKTIARIGISLDPADTMSSWRKRYGPAIPVIVFRTDAEPDFVAGIAQPGVHSIEDVAALQNLPIDSRYRQLVLSTVRQLGELGVSLLSEWFTAVANATEQYAI